MRTTLFLSCGFLLLAASAILARLFSANFPAAAAWTTGVFVAVWLAITAFNMWVGVTRAGYSVAEEWPIALLLFTLPVALAIFLKWKVL